MMYHAFNTALTQSVATGTQKQRKKNLGKLILKIEVLVKIKLQAFVQGPELIQSAFWGKIKTLQHLDMVVPVAS